MSFIHIPKSQFILMTNDRNDGEEVAIAGYGTTSVTGNNCGVVHLHNITRLLSGTASMPSNPWSLPINTNISGLRLYKGTIPTASSFKTDGTCNTGENYSSDNWLSARGGDRLIHFPVNTGTSTKFTSGDGLHVGLSGANATGTGTATWFALNIVGSTTGGYNYPPHSVLIGTVSVAGGGGDIELLNVDIVNGQTYKINSVKIPFPLKFTW